MAWTDGDLRIFAAGLSIGGQWNHTGQAMLPPPSADPPPGSYYGQVLYVKLFTSTEGAIIRYSTDGTLPSAIGQPFDEAAPIEISQNITVRAYAQRYNQISRIAELVYKVDNPFVVKDIVTITTRMLRATCGTVDIGFEHKSPVVSDLVKITNHLLTISEDVAEIEIITA